MGYTEIQNYVPSNKYNIKCPYAMTPIGVTVHNTYNDATARNESNYMKNNNNSTSFHDVVDDKEVVHCIPHNRNAFHAGDGNDGTGNRKTIGVEICYSKSGGSKFDQAEQNAAAYIATILKARNWTIKNVYRHKDWSGKNCPHRTMEKGWDRFLGMIQNELNKLGGTGWQKDNQGWWYKNADGTYPVSAWKEINGEWYYFDERGYMVTGWEKIKGVWYYLEDSGKMATGWIQLDGKWYYLAESGAMVTGLQTIGSETFYFAADGHMCRTNDRGALV